MSSAQPDLSRPAVDASRPPRRRRRPFGLYMILILLSLQAITGVLLTVALGIGMIFEPGTLWPALAPDLLDAVLPFILMLVTGVVLVGLWRYRTWGWYGMMLLLAYYTASDAIAYFAGQVAPISMLFNVVMVFYLNQREVRDLFEQTAAGEVVP